jgi:SAM-dependent methyltransferase
MKTHTDFFSEILDKLEIKKSASIAVVCGGKYDANVLRTAGYQNVTISNIDEQQTDLGFAWSYQDAENLTFLDESFDWVIVNAGLHHCTSPHRALLEMYRVCKEGVLLIEARDSLLMRSAVGLGLVPRYELEAVVIEGWKTGGVRNSAIPNFIYRWTEREVHKSIESAWPQFIHKYRYFYGLRFPSQRLSMTAFRPLNGPIKILVYLLQLIVPKQGNKFGAAVIKTGELKPWIDSSGTKMSRNYKLGFDPKKYKE